MTPPAKIIILGLSLSSSWGNGHATTYRSLIRGLAAHGAHVHFLERDVPWYADNRDIGQFGYCQLDYYTSLNELEHRFGRSIRAADAVVVGSYVPDGIAVIDLLHRLGVKHLNFYDIDTPVTLAGLDRGEADYLARRQVPIFATYFSFSGGESPRRLERVYGARRAAPLYCSVDETTYRPTGERVKWDLGYLGTYSSDRQPMLERLLLEPARRLPDKRFVVAGSMYPTDIAWPANVERVEHLAPDAHPSFYSRQRFTLNVTRPDMVAAGWSPSVRLFEAGAVGTPIVSDRWRGLGAFLPENDAILTAESPDEVVAILTQTTERERRRIGENARTRILAAHTGGVRAGELIRELWPATNATSSASLEAV